MHSTKTSHRVNKLIAKYLERKNDKTISLNESVLRAEEEELKQEKKEEEEAVKQANGGDKKDIFPQDFYNKELVNISIDYLELLAASADYQKLKSRRSTCVTRPVLRSGSLTFDFS